MNDLLDCLSHNPTQFRDMINFFIEEFMELYTFVVLTIESNAWSTGHRHIILDCPSKLTLEQRLLNFVLYMKHDNVIYLDSILWNWS